MNFKDAVEIYVKHINDSNSGAEIFQQPNRQVSKLTNGVWYLRNSFGFLARVGTVSKKVVAAKID